MKAIVLILACLTVIGCAGTYEPPPPPPPPGMIRVADGKFVLRLPEDWYQVTKEENYRSRGFSAAFGKEKRPGIPFSYCLVQVTKQKKWPKMDMEVIVHNAVPLENVRDLAAYISSRKYKNDLDLYSAKLDMFFIIYDYAEGDRLCTTIMAKRFCDRHYVVFHFFLREDLQADVNDIAYMLRSVIFDEDRVRRTR